MRSQRLSSSARIGGVALAVSALLIGIHWADAAEMTGTPK
jgi:hypothetical protein